MRFPRRATASALTPILLVAAAAGCDAGAAEAVTKVVIGVDLELSGAGAAAGAAYERGLRLKIEQVNASGLLGSRQLALELKDNGSDPSTSLRNVGAFADDPAVAAVVAGACAECIVGAVKTVEDRKVPTISLASAVQVTDPVDQRRYVFTLAPNAADTAAALVAEWQRLKFDRVAVLHADSLYGRNGNDAMQAELRKAGIEFTSAATTSRPEQVTTAVGTLVGALPEGERSESGETGPPDALAVWAPAEQAIPAATAARTAEFKGEVYFDAAAGGDLFLPFDPKSRIEDTRMVFAQSLVVDDVIATTPAKAARKQWFRDYTSRYGGYSGAAAFAADAVALIAEAVAKVGGDREKIRQLLETSQADGLSGPIKITADNHSGLMPQALTLLVARSGRWRLLS